jgi:hypothetical protein
MNFGLRRCVVGGIVAAWAAAAQAGLVDVGSQYTVNNVNFLDTFTANITLDGTTKTIDSGNLNLSETIVSDGPNAVWVVFSFSTTNGGSLATNTDDFWQGEINNISFTIPVVLDAFFEYWAVDGTPFSGITNLFGNTTVATNPITGVGEVYLGIITTPAPPSAQHTLFTWLSPYSQLSGHNIDPDTANSWHIAGHFSVPPSSVPEPAGLALAGIGAAGTAIMSIRRRRTGATA